MHSGTGNTHKVTILEKGMKFHANSVEHKEAQMAMTLEQAIKEVNNIRRWREIRSSAGSNMVDLSHIDFSAILTAMEGAWVIVAKLPKTKDGVPIDLSERPVMLWISDDDEGYGVYEECCYDREDVEKAYSTREAAAAREVKHDQH
jgi:hypothetical protein